MLLCSYIDSSLSLLLCSYIDSSSSPLLYSYKDLSINVTLFLFRRAHHRYFVLIRDENIRYIRRYIFDISDIGNVQHDIGDD